MRINTNNIRISLDLDQGHFVIEKIFDQTIGLPIIFFNPDTNSAHYVRLGEQQGSTISFASKIEDTTDTLSSGGFISELQGQVTCSNTTIEFNVKATSRIGLMCPCPSNFNVYPHNFLMPCPELFTSTYFYLNNISHIEHAIEVSSPCFEFAKEQKIINIQSNKVPTCFNIFDFQESNYMNIVTNEKTNKFIISTEKYEPDYNSKLLDIKNIDVCGSTTLNPNINCSYDILTPSDMRKVFFYGIVLKKSSPSFDNIIINAQKIQHILEQAGIKSAVMGSLAMTLYGIKTQIKDIDIAIAQQDINKCIDCLQKNGINATKLQDYRIAVKHNSSDIDIFSYDEDFQYLDNRKYIKNLHVIDIDKLTGCRLWLETVLDMLYDNTQHIKNDNNRKLLEFMDNSDFFLLHPYYRHEIQKWKCRYEELLKITNLFQDRIESKITVCCKYPCRAKAFDLYDKTLISVVNLGSPKTFRISFSKECNKVRWISSLVDKELMASSYLGYTEINVEVIDMGILVIS